MLATLNVSKVIICNTFSLYTPVGVGADVFQTSSNSGLQIAVNVFQFTGLCHESQSWKVLETIFQYTSAVYQSNQNSRCELIKIHKSVHRDFIDKPLF